ncbi:hypothetical protein QFW77_04645 [Luteimonas sp. RD2P54]|uniref:Uncharacterized protein n=1 Tax=Luteimonas endophytica TaxID=3042023 RepID=A0ABT6J7U6_9GAMM|nr:hypothetical protein [Luteimonas endophytica]MDH5822278.1 hypothetical protein [Luteimonas endophytica]
MTMTPRDRLLTAWLLAVTALAGWTAWDRIKAGPATTAAPPAASAAFEELTVERINVVEPNGLNRLVISNAARFPGLFMEGTEYRHHSRTGGGMLFFNDEGDESGGMSFSSAREDGAYAASAGLFFDQYKQDQTVGVVYNDQDGRRVAGLRVWDRPDYSIGPLMEMSDRAARAESHAAREAIREEMMDYAMARGGAGAERLFAGKALEDAVLRLADPQGRPRLQLTVDGAGEPRVDFLAEDGTVLRSITAQ